MRLVEGMYRLCEWLLGFGYFEEFPLLTIAMNPLSGSEPRLGRKCIT
jgi:hypothetical protein